MLSVVIPAYERPTELRHVLERVRLFMTGPFEKLEVIVVNDGGSYLDAIIGEFPTFNSLYLEPTTTEYRLGMARNMGAAIAKGDRILFLDADCMPRVETLYVHAAYGAKNIVVAGRIDQVASREGHPVIDAITRDRRYRLYRHVLKPLETQSAFFTNYYPAFWGGHLSVPAAEFKACGGFWEEIKEYGSEDQELAWRMAKRDSRLRIDFTAAVDHIGPQSQQKPANHRKSILNRSALEPSLVRRGRFLP